MTRTARVWLITLAVLAAYLLLTWFLGGWLGLTGWDLWILRIGLWVVGFVAAGLVLWFLLSRPAGAAPEPTQDELDLTIASARARLAAARVARGAPLRDLPVVLFLGPEGSAKTSVIAHSGLEPDLIAGEVFRGAAVLPTAGVNLWYTQKTVFIEAGGGLTGADRWARLIHHIRPRRLVTLLPGRTPPPRLAVVCFSCEALAQPGSAQAVPAAAQALRERLLDVSRGLGIQLPVYVLFTKADRLPHFDDFARNLSREEAQQIVGATLAWPPRRASASYAELEYRRVEEALRRLFNSMAAARPELLSREAGEEQRGGVYEFPREIRKLADLASRFVVELCRPKQLQVSPVLRGVYFSGVRPVVIADAAARAPQVMAGERAAMAATQVFDLRQAQADATPARPAPVGGRKIPEWVFVGDLFRSVFIGDRVAQAVTQMGARLMLRRRLLLGAATGLSLLFTLGMLVSYANNRRLQTRVLDAARALVTFEVTPPGQELPTAAALRRLETLRAQLAVLSRYQREGAPWRFRWGLYSGPALYPIVRQMYYDRVEGLMLDPARASVLASLREIPDAPRETADYNRAYDLLMAYLMTTTHPDKIAPRDTFLAPRLLERWLRGREIDTERLELAGRQFAFYGELCQTHDCTADADVRAVQVTRTFLQGFSGTDRIYRVMIAEASGQHPPVQFASAFPGATDAVTDDYQVPGAFTRRGWTFMRDAFRNVDQFFGGADWVLGGEGQVPQNRADLVDQLRARYVADYVRHWREYLSAAEIVRYGGVGDAARKLARLSSNQSPMLQLLFLAAQETTVDSALVGAAFQPVHLVTPPDVTDKYIGESNQAYMQALIALQSSVEQAAAAPAGRAEGLVGQVLENAQRARAAARQLALQFSIDGEAKPVGEAVQRLLREPVTRVEGLLQALPANALNAAGGQLCQPFRRLATQYPFDPRATNDASLADVAGLLQPGAGALWTFYQETLQELLVLQGDRYMPKVGASVRPTPAFLEFFNRAASVSNTLWRGGRQDARIEFTFRPVLSEALPGVTLSVDGRTQRYTRTQVSSQPFTWNGATAREVSLRGDIGGRDELLLRFQGQWALFRLFERATGWRPVGDLYVVQWDIATPDRSVTFQAEVNFAGAPPVLRSGYLTGLTCVSQIVR